MTTLEPQQIYNWRAHRHYLVNRAPRRDLVNVVARLGGLQAQVMSAAELQAWARVDHLTIQEVRDALWRDHSLVKTWAWRGTLHLLASSEFPTYVAALTTRSRHTSSAWLTYFDVTLEEMNALVDGIRDSLDGRNLTRDEVATEVARVTGKPHWRDALLSGWGSLLKPSAFRGDLAFGPSQGQAVTFVRPDQWIGPMDEQDSGEALKELARRYLTNYGPASREDFARWFGMTPPEAGRILNSMSDETESITVPAWHGWKGFALKKDLRAISNLKSPSTPSVRLLPPFDPYVVARSHASIHAVPDYKVNRERIYRVAGWVTPTVIIDGRIEGIWDYQKRPKTLPIKLEMLDPRTLTSPVKHAIEQEIASLGTFLDAKPELELGRLDK
jgi:hypothetical protein